MKAVVCVLLDGTMIHQHAQNVPLINGVREAVSPEKGCVITIVHLINTPMDLVKVIQMNVVTVGIDNTSIQAHLHVEIAGLTPDPTQIRPTAFVTPG